MSGGAVIPNAVLCVPAMMSAQWGDGVVTAAYELPAGTRVRVSLVGDGPAGWWARVHDCQTPVVFATVPMSVLSPLGVPMPEWAVLSEP